MAKYAFRHVFRGIMMVLVGIVVIAIVGLVVMKLWNGLMPAIFDLTVITYWQALGLLVLSKLLFGGFRGFGGGRPRWRRRMRDRWEQMTPEERQNFKQGMRGMCGSRPREAQA